MKCIGLIGLGLLFFSTALGATNIETDTVVLRGLDKVTGRISTFSIPIGEVGQFGKTFVAPESCLKHPPEESPEDSAFLYIYEKSLKGENIELFKGWMFSSNPALSSMEHPVYDIWVLECRQTKEVKDVANASEPNVPQDLDILDETLPVLDEDSSSEQAISSLKKVPVMLEEKTYESSSLVPSIVEMEDL